MVKWIKVLSVTLSLTKEWWAYEATCQRSPASPLCRLLSPDLEGLHLCPSFILYPTEQCRLRAELA